MTRLSEPEAKALGAAIEAIIPHEARFIVIYLCEDGTLGSLSSMDNVTRNEILQAVIDGEALSSNPNRIARSKPS